jgi:hypothetical protein
VFAADIACVSLGLLRVLFTDTHEQRAWHLPLANQQLPTYEVLD